MKKIIYVLFLVVGMGFSQAALAGGGGGKRAPSYTPPPPPPPAPPVQAPQAPDSLSGVRDRNRRANGGGNASTLLNGSNGLLVASDGLENKTLGGNTLLGG